MSHIASPHNPRLKAVRRLHTRRERARTGSFLAEGEDLIAAAARAGRAPLAGYRLTGSGLGGEDFHDVERSALASVSALGSGTRVIGVYEQRWCAPEGPLCVYLHGVRDPGNIGTVLRSAHAFGASCVALGPGCADPHSPKAVRASMGAIFDVALARVGDVGELPRGTDRAGGRRTRAAAPGARPGHAARRRRARRTPRRAPRRLRALRPHTHQLGLAQRRHGRHRRPVRDDPQRLSRNVPRRRAHARPHK